MNRIIKEKGLKAIKGRISFYNRVLGKKKTSYAFNEKEAKHINRIYVINLDRKPDRWHYIKKELNRIRINGDKRLLDISRRFSAIDARNYEYNKNNEELKNYYKLSDQFKVEPNNKYKILMKEDDLDVFMTKQEIAVTLSHINVWKKMKEEGINYALILEDDIYFTSDFAKKIDTIWKQIQNNNFDILFLSFEYAKGTSVQNSKTEKIIHKPHVGIWQASGYVLSKKGVEKLIKELPVYGPVDLWLNLKFDKIEAYMINEPIIRQRADLESTNSYSIMPVFTKLGLYSEEKPLILRQNRKLPALLVYGDKESGLASLSEALSMIGYTCCSNLSSFPQKYIQGRKKTLFNAYINVGELNEKNIKEIRKNYKKIKVIYTSENYEKLLSNKNLDTLYLQKNEKDKWDKLSKFLHIDYPSFKYPIIKDKEQLNYVISYNDSGINMKWDKLPWIIKTKENAGIEILDEVEKSEKTTTEIYSINQGLDYSKVEFRKDTFSSNLSLFIPQNIQVRNEGIELNLKKEKCNVREYSASAIVVKKPKLFGEFKTIIKPSGIEGIITGIFLHRNSPHQEIDIEFLGKNHYGFLANVFYNPGIEGTRLEYGYRGTPTWIDLGFDVTKEFHEYGIVWSENYIIWMVDENIVYKRNIWQPTPIPQLPMQFNINIWNTKSKELAGNLNDEELPARSLIKKIEITE